MPLSSSCFGAQFVSEFSTKEKDHKSSLTAACLDHKGRRLLTAHHDGTGMQIPFHGRLPLG